MLKFHSITAGLLLGALALPAAESISFNRHIRPVLSDKCFGCHGPDKSHRKAKLRLDIPEGAFAKHDDGAAIVAGDAAASQAMIRMLSKDPDEQMPPPESHKSLDPAEIELIRKWIAGGAVYEAHWAYAPLKQPQPPDVSLTASPIDKFVKESLRGHGRKLSPEADRVTLLRRLSFDLVGLPPTPAEVADFVNDRRPDAWERQVDRLLASPHFGERWAIMWLDLVRYADSVGYHGDQEWSAWPYRDWVINALNRNEPFDQFTREQLAGDLLPDATLEQKIASGYNRLNMITAEGGAQAKEYRTIYNADRVRNVSGAWMGSTLGCAQCHDHKYDPFTTRDFYSMAAFFADVTERDVYNGASKKADWGPYLTIPDAENEARIKAIDAEIAVLEAERKDAAARPAAAAWAQRQAATAGPTGWRVGVPSALSASDGVTLAYDAASGVIQATGETPARSNFAVTLPAGAATLTAIQLEVLPAADGKIGAGNGNIVLSEFTVKIGDGKPVHPDAAEADFSQKDFPVAAALKPAVDAGWAVDGHVTANRAHTAVFHFKKPLQVLADSPIHITMAYQSQYAQHYPRQFRLSVTDSPAAKMQPPGSAALYEALKAAPEARTDEQWQVLAAGLQAELERKLGELREERKKLESSGQLALTTVALATPRTVRIQPRGNWMDESGAIVEPDTPEFLPALHKAGERGSRLDLANWLVSSENPLTSRALANRIWAQLFGAGLSRDLADMGNQGQWPEHPVLLDYLASDLIGNGWNLKNFIRSITLSEAYRQQSVPDTALATADPYNSWLGRQGRFRLAAELVRDNALAVSGLLTADLGGENARPYQPSGYYDNLNFPRRNYQADKGSQQYRRGVYTHWQRTFLHPALRAFDAPSREECTASRTASNTPLQALDLLNDPTMVEAARALAERVLREAPTDTEGRLRWMWTTVLSRPADTAEMAELRNFQQLRMAEYAADEGLAKALLAVGDRPAATDLPIPDQAAWAATCRVVLNLHETIVRN